MTFHILTLFPGLFPSYLDTSIVGRGIKSKKLKVVIYDLRKFAVGKHHKLDDTPYGGGPGMVLMAGPIVKAIERALSRKRKDRSLVVFTEASGKQFTNDKADKLSKNYKDIVIVAGRYEGIDERAKEMVKRGLGVKTESISVGPYVLTGGELPALIMVDAISRRVEGVLGKGESIEELRHGVGVPVYTRPEKVDYKGREYKVPRVLLSGDHSQINSWRSQKKSS